jgi:hypothetical protein
MAKSVQGVSKHRVTPTAVLTRKSLALRRAPGRARTCNPMIRSHILYPINLRVAYKRGQITYLRMAMSIKRVVSTGKEFFRRSRAQLS